MELNGSRYAISIDRCHFRILLFRLAHRSINRPILDSIISFACVVIDYLPFPLYSPTFHSRINARGDARWFHAFSEKRHRGRQMRLNHQMIKWSCFSRRIIATYVTRHSGFFAETLRNSAATQNQLRHVPFAADSLYNLCSEKSSLTLFAL